MNNISGLNNEAIEILRKTVNPSLNRYPRHATEILDESENECS